MKALTPDSGDATTALLPWLLQGDPVIRWQVLRDLQQLPEADWRNEQLRTTEIGWGAEFIARMQADSTWPTGRWTGTLWTLLVIIDCGMPRQHPRLRDAARRFIDENLTPERASDEKWLMNRMDLCHLGFWLRIGAYFLGADPRLTPLTETILRAQMADGGWNCRRRNYPNTHHSSFHTTFNILEGLAHAAEVGVVDPETADTSIGRALEFMLVHRMYRSDRTGDPIDPRFLHLTYPSHWHYTVLRGLDFMRQYPAIADARLDDAIEVLTARRLPKGFWPVEKRIPGTEHFDMEKPGGPSRWNTLRILRVLKARSESQRTVTSEKRSGVSGRLTAR